MKAHVTVARGIGDGTSENMHSKSCTVETSGYEANVSGDKIKKGQTCP